MLKNKVYYVATVNSVEPIKIIEEFPTDFVNVKSLTSGNTYCVSNFTIYDTEEEACKKLINYLEDSKDQLESDIKDLQEEVEITNKIIEDLKQRI